MLLRRYDVHGDSVISSSLNTRLTGFENVIYKKNIMNKSFKCFAATVLFVAGAVNPCLLRAQNYGLLGMDVFPKERLLLPTKDSVPMLRTAGSQPSPFVINTNETPKMYQPALPSPNATALGQFGSIPVGYYTGVPEISVPIYELNLNGKSIPVNISYHASGITVAQEASMVGLGWVLNAGGCITKEVNGWDDFSNSPTGYYYNFNNTLPSTNNFINTDSDIFPQELYTYEQHMKNQWEREPDMFHFNFAGFSGTMFFDLCGRGENTYSIAKAMILNEKEYLDARYHINSKSWVITDALGFAYYFNTKENTVTYQTRENATQYFAPYRPLLRRDIQPETITAWLLDSIVSPQKNVIRFNYTIESVYSIPVSSERVYYSNLDQKPTNLDFHYKYYSCSSQIQQQALLKNIQLDNENLTFTYSDRLDIESSQTGVKAKKLQGINIKDKDESIKNITFEYSYLGNVNDYSKCRLMLDSLLFAGNSSQSIKYSFVYNREELPAKNSLSQDYWGYYNGGTGPSYTDINYLNTNGFYWSAAPPYLSDTGYYIPGFDKTPDEKLMLRGMLTNIIYPTGGKTVFEYEAHTFLHSGVESPLCAAQTIELTKWSYVTLYEGNPEGEIMCDALPTDTFSMQENGWAMLHYEYSKKSYDKAEYMNPMVVTIEKLSGNKFIPFKTSEFSFDEESESRNIRFYFPKGTYRMDITMPKEHSPENVYLVLTGLYNKVLNKGGGLRIKQIADFTEENSINRRIFSYDKSGALILLPEYHKKVVLYSDLSEESEILDHGNIVHYYYGSNSPASPLKSSSLSGYVGYSFIEERKIGTNNEDNGTTEYYFNNMADETTEYPTLFILNYPTIPYLNNGSPSEIYYYDQKDNLKRKKTFQYVRTNQRSVKGLKVQTLPFTMTYIRFYDVYSERWHLEREIDEEYFENTTTPKVTTTEYQYNATNWLCNYTKSSINGHTMEKFIKYPNDFNNAANIGMCRRSMIGIPLEQLVTKDGKIIDGQRTVYKDTLGMYLPDAVDALSMTIPGTWENYTQFYEEKLKIGSYNKNGNAQYQQSATEKVTFLWSYNNKKIVAMINNVTYQEVENALTATYLKSLTDSSNPDIKRLDTMLRTLLANKIVLITTYSYKPLVGLMTTTDPKGLTTYYNYDCFHRLCEVYRMNNNIKEVIESYTYKYAIE